MSETKNTARTPGSPNPGFARGFLSAAVHCGLKKGDAPDLGLLVAPVPIPAAAVFTRNLVAAAPVILSRMHVAGGSVRAVVVNAGNANACTGEQGMHDAVATAQCVADAVGCAASEVFVCSTGVIGVPLPLDLVCDGIAAAAGALTVDGADEFARAIMTTDTVPKRASATFESDGVAHTVEGTAKGSGMIRPDMATMLAFITTDAPLTSAACDHVLRAAAARTFNRLTVDGDTSTNDTAVLLASGAAGGPPIEVDSAACDAAEAAIHEVCLTLARAIAADGEGATKLVEVTVTGAQTEQAAEKAAFTVAESPLVKTAIFGRDANWGRVAAAVGRSGASLDPGALAVTFAGIEVCRDGGAVPFDEDEALAALSADEIEIRVDLGCGTAQATVLTCDLTYEYVRINGAYRS